MNIIEPATCIQREVPRALRCLTPNKRQPFRLLGRHGELDGYVQISMVTVEFVLDKYIIAHARDIIR
jgi:hypothetical protein